MAIAVANCSQTPLALEGPPKQSMWQRLDFPRPSSDNSRNKHDNLTRRISRKVGVSLPRNPKRQSADFERLAPQFEHRRALSAISADRRPLSAQTASPPPTDPRQSAPEIQWLGPPTTKVDDIEPEIETNAEIDMSQDWDYPDPDPELDMDYSKSPDVEEGEEEEEEEDIIDLDAELEQRWILNLSMHFRDRSEREKFFVTYAETPNRWRRVTVSCDYRDAPPDSLEGELKGLRYQRDKCARIYESIRESLLGIRFYDTVTNLKLETSDGQLHVYVTEDVNETIPYPPISSIGHLVGAPMIPEHMLHFESHLSGFVYKVNFGGRFYIKKEIPGPDTVDEFLYEINALHALNGIPSVIQVEGIVIDEERCVVKGLLISYAEQGALVDILYEQHGRTEFARRERWAKQIIQGLCEIHESGYVQGDFTLANIVVDANDNAKIIDINRRGCPVGWEPPEIAAKIESNQRISMYIGVKTDLFQLGMTLWALAMEDDEPERQPRPLYLGEDAKVPDYYRRIVQICLSPNPRHRLSAKELLFMFPPDIRSAWAPAARPLEMNTNDPRQYPFRNNWPQPPPSEFPFAAPGGMMRQPDQYYTQKDFSNNAYGGMQHSDFEKHDFAKRSTITLTESNEDMGFPSQPSSSSTLNHSPNNDEYYSRYSDDQPPQYLPSENRDFEAPSVSHATTLRSNGFQNDPVELPTPTDETLSRQNAPMNNQQSIAQDISTGSTNEHTPNLPGSANTTPTVNQTPPKPSKQDNLNRPSKRAANNEDLLTSSCLAINPALSSHETSHSTQPTPSLMLPPSTPPMKRDSSNQPSAKNANTMTPFTGPSASNSSTIGSGSPLSPKSGNMGASLGLGTKFPAASPFTNMLRQSGGQPFKSADVNFAPPTPSNLSSLKPSTSSMQKAAYVSYSAQTTPIELSPSEPTKNKEVGQPRAKAIEMKPTLAIESDSSSLLGSSLPISPATRDSMPIEQAVDHSNAKPVKLKPVLRSESKSTPSLLHSALPISPASANSKPLAQLCGMDVKPVDAKPASAISSRSTSSLLHSELPTSPASANSKPIAWDTKEPHAKLADVQPTLLRSPDSTASLIDSRLPISPATINSSSIAEAMHQPFVPPINVKATLTKPSDSALSLLGSKLPISPASADSVPVAKTLAEFSRPVKFESELAEPSDSSLLSSSLPISPASPDSGFPAKAMNQRHSNNAVVKSACKQQSDLSSLLSSSLPISPAPANTGPPANATIDKPISAQQCDPSTLHGSSLPISPTFANSIAGTATEVSPAVHQPPSGKVPHPIRHRPATYFSRTTS
ncbi:uncharacterized protein N7529_000247 [Penicillium soppii]|uniref:uncharacterized protein n=1 Tax=Penicillium soppii TaxID=69789 RepID=UPI00254946EC|nr:uncharacterized protein N7529_000247 [Penicillium soppii]KAJ5881575.1 hypothetical protein N7529_000247 [Penicillium soppii]